MATTISRMPHWLTMPSAACTCALSCPATHTATKPMKNIRYIMSICGQVSRQTARGAVLRSGAGLVCGGGAPRREVTLIQEAARQGFHAGG